MPISYISAQESNVGAMLDSRLLKTLILGGSGPAPNRKAPSRVPGYTL